MTALTPHADGRVPGIIGPKAHKYSAARGEASLSESKCGEVADAFGGSCDETNRFFHG